MGMSSFDRWLTTDPREADQEAYERWVEDNYPDDEDDHWDEFEQEMSDLADEREIEIAESRREDWE